jgi:hypothetical protein
MRALKWLLLPVVAFAMTARAADPIPFSAEGLLVKKDNLIFLVFTAGGVVQEMQVSAGLAAYVGQNVWVKGHHYGPSRNQQAIFLNVQNLITSKNEVAGQGAVLTGSLKPNQFGGVDLFPAEEDALARLGKSKVRVVFPDTAFYRGYYRNFRQTVYRASVTGFIRGDAIFILPDPDAFEILKPQAQVEAGEVVVLSGTVDENLDRYASVYRNHGYGSGDTYGLMNKDSAVWEITGISDVFIKDPKTGELAPASVARVSYIRSAYEIRVDSTARLNLYASPAGVEAWNLVREGKKMTFVGHMAGNDHLIIEDAIDFVGSSIPSITETRPDRHQIKPQGGPSEEACLLSMKRRLGPAHYLVKPEQR